MTDTGLPIRVRSLLESDKPLVFSTWLRSYRAHGEACRGVPSRRYYDAHHWLVERAMSRADWRVACDPECESSVFGWCCYESGAASDLLHYVYVKEKFMRYGLATLLTEPLGRTCYYTHTTDVVRELRRSGKIPPDWVYDPYPFMLEAS